MEEYFSCERAFAYLPKIFSVFPTTLLIVAVALTLGSALGILIAFVRIHRTPVLYPLSLVYVSFIRGTPQIVQLFIIYYGVPLLSKGLFGLNIDRLDAIYFVLIAYGINESAFLSELFRGGLQAVPLGQYEAGSAIGLTGWQTFHRIILPQAARIILPGFGVEIVGLFQSTSLAATIGVIDIMGKAALLGSATYHYTESYFSAAVIFVTISILLEVLFRYLNKRLAYHY